VPARILELTDAEVQEIQLVENIQREGLTPIEEGRAFKRYLETTKSTQQRLADRVGKTQSYVANRVRLVALPGPVQQLIDSGKLASSHAEVLLKLDAAQPDVIVDAAKQAVSSGVSVNELNRAVSRQVEEVQRAKKFQESISKVKFPKCPTCGKPATGTGYDGVIQHDDYDPKHQWSPSTGKTMVDFRREQEAKWRAKHPAAAGAPEKKRPKPADCRESPLIRSAHDPMALVQAILKGAGAKGIELVEYESPVRVGESTRGAVLRVGFTTKPMGDVHTIARPLDYSSGERSQIVLQDTDAVHRRASRSKVESWEKRALPALKLKPAKPKVFDAKLLVGLGDTVNGRLHKLREDPEMLELARAAEVKGKHRAAVLDYIDEALLGRGHNSYSGYGGDRRL
jgi:ParB-like chromosome segregation protein Spo0J